MSIHPEGTRALVERAAGTIVDPQQDPAFWEVMQNVVTMGDLSGLSPEMKTKYYRYVCQSIGLNAATQPFGYIKSQGKLTLYANRNAADQLAKIHQINTTILSKERAQDERGDPVYMVMARVETPDGRRTERLGAVSIKGLGGEDYCNALMKTETKAARRAVIAHIGLGVLDETEASSIAGARLYQPSEVERDDFALPAETSAPPTPIGATAHPAPPAASNVHQQAELRRLVGAGFPIAAELAARGLESIDDLDAEAAKELIVAGRTYVRSDVGARPSAPAAPVSPPIVEHVTPDMPFVLTAGQISLFWATGAQEGWTQEGKRNALRQLYPERLDQDGTVSIKSLSHGEFDGMIALFKGERELVKHDDGTVTLRAAGPPDGEKSQQVLG